MGLFKDKTKVLDVEFDNFNKNMCDDYISNNKNEFFLSNFDNLNRINTENGSSVLCLDNKYFYVLYKPNKLIAFDSKSFLYLKNSKNIILNDIMYISNFQLNKLTELGYKVLVGQKMHNPVINIRNLISLKGYDYNMLITNRNSFIKNIKDELDFREYNHEFDEVDVTRLYNINNPNNTIGRTLFKDCLISDYHYKYVATVGDIVIGFISCMYMSNKYISIMYNIIDGKHKGSELYMLIELSKLLDENIKSLNLNSGNDNSILNPYDNVVYYYSNKIF